MKHSSTMATAKPCQAGICNSQPWTVFTASWLHCSQTVLGQMLTGSWRSCLAGQAEPLPLLLLVRLRCPSSCGLMQHISLQHQAACRKGQNKHDQQGQELPGVLLLTTNRYSLSCQHAALDNLAEGCTRRTNQPVLTAAVAEHSLFLQTCQLELKG
jgi:hypothetical protein